MNVMSPVIVPPLSGSALDVPPELESTYALVAICVFSVTGPKYLTASGVAVVLVE